MLLVVVNYAEWGSCRMQDDRDSDGQEEMKKNHGDSLIIYEFVLGLALQ